MRHFKILGWLWLLFGVYWCSLLLYGTVALLIAPSTQIDQNVAETTSVWWTDLIACVLEVAFFIASALFGLALLRRWRRAHVAIGVLGAFMLALYVWLASPSFPPST